MRDSQFFTLFKERVKQAVAAESTQREHERADQEFEAGQHWDPKVQDAREREGRPCLTIDLLSGSIKQVTNQQRTARPGIKISPVGGGADEDMALLWQGAIRRVERLSQAQRVYTWAGQHQAVMGRGFWVVRNIRIGDGPEQDIRLEEVENQHSIYCDPACKKLNGEDKRWAIRYEDLTHEEYKARFGESSLAESLANGQLSGLGDTVPEWITTTHARIAEYYYIKEQTKNRALLASGEKVDDLELPDDGTPDAPLHRWTTTKNTVQWCLLNGAGEELDKATIPGEFVPVVMVHGERRYVNGKRDFRGLVRMAKDPSRMEDFCESSLMEAISDAKTSPWMAEEDQIAEYEHLYAMAPTKRIAVLKYKKVLDAPPPHRIPSGVDVAALTMAAQRMQNHVRTITGQQDVYQDETASDRGKLSGRAIQARRQQQELGTSDYMENLGDGIVLTAKIIMSMARDGVWDTPQLMRITGEDEKQSAIITYSGEDQQQHAQELAQSQKKIAGMLDVSLGEYDLAIAPGRRHDTARQEAREALEALPPELLAQGADIYVSMIDAPGMPELAKRLKKANPLAQDDQQPPLPPEAQQKMQQMGQMIELLSKELQAANKIIETDQAKSQGDLQKQQAADAAKIEIARAELQVKLQIAAMQEQTKLELAEIAFRTSQMQAEIDSQENALARGHEYATGAVDREHDNQARQEGFAHEAATGAAGAGTQAASDAASRQHEGQMAEQGHKHAVAQIKAKPKPTNEKGA